MTIEISKAAFGAILALLVLLAYLHVRKLDRDQKSGFRVEDYLMKDGRASISKTGQFVALGVSSWAFVYMTLTNHLTEAYFSLYIAVWTSAKFGDKALDIWAMKKDEPK